MEANQRLTPIQGREAVVLGDGDDVTARQVIPSALRRNTEARFSYPRNLRARPIVRQRAAVTVRQDHFRSDRLGLVAHGLERIAHVGPRLLGRDDDGERWGRRLGHGSLLERAVGGRILPEREAADNIGARRGQAHLGPR